VFVEDTCIALDEVAVLTRPGACSRQPEVDAVAAMVGEFRPVSFLRAPATFDGGDVLRLGRNLFVGLSSRTNQAGIDQLRSLVGSLGYRVIPIQVTRCLHLKSAACEVGPGAVLVNRDWVDPTPFEAATTIEVDSTEPFGANALLVRGTVVYPDSFPKTAGRLLDHGIRVRTVDVSELAKAEGGVSCCSVLVEQGQAE
jgi:dimethylargininase